MKKISPLLLLLFAITFSINAQNNGLFKMYLFDNVSNQFLKVFENKSDVYNIEQGHYKGFPTIDYTTTIVFQNGTKKILEKNELVISTSNGNLITQIFDLTNSRTKICCYKISISSLMLLNKIEFEGEQQIDVLENGAIIISDQWELYGTIIGIYDSQLKLLNNFKPYEIGFKNAVFTASENKIISIVSKEEEKLETKYFEIDAASGKVIMQKELEANLNPVKILSFGNKTFVIENNKTTALTSGELTWEKNIVLPNYDIVCDASQNALYYFTRNNFVKISATNGNELFSKNLSEIYGNKSDTTNLMIRPIAFKTSFNNVNTFILLAETNAGILLNTNPKLNPKLFLIDVSGNLLENKKTNLSSFNWADIIETKDHKTKLITDKQQIDIQ